MTSTRPARGASGSPSPDPGRQGPAPAPESTRSGGPSVAHRLGVAALVATLILGGATGTVYWFEADKEVRILCGLMAAGTPRSEVTRILGTAHLLEVHPAGVDPATAVALSFDAPANLRTTRCDLTLGDGGVGARAFARRIHLERLAAGAASPLLLLLVGLQVGLARGRVSGRMAWGGRSEVLTPSQRRASAASAVLLVGVGWILLERAGLLGLLEGSPLVEPAAWAVVLLWLLSTAGNLASASRPERRLGIPVATALAILSLVIAYSG